MIDRSEDLSKLAPSLLKAQQEIGRALNSSSNPYFKSSYANLLTVIEAVKGPLNTHGIAFLQAVDRDESGAPMIDTILLHETGQYISSRTPVYCKKPDDPQAFGSGVTYSKRYALQSIMGLPTADDDGEQAMARNSKQAEKPAPPDGPTPWDEPQTSPENTPPAMTDKAKDIMDQAFFEFETIHTNDIATGFAIDATKFNNVVWQQFHKWPTRKDSVKQIVEKIKLADVMVEL